MASPTIFIPSSGSAMPAVTPADRAKARLSQAALVKLTAFGGLIAFLAYVGPFLAA